MNERQGERFAREIGEGVCTKFGDGDSTKREEEITLSISQYQLFS